MILEINKSSKEHIMLLEKFVSTMGNSNKSFRYFTSRSLKVIKNHISTILLISEGIPIGYGHLDKQDSQVWFGIAIAEGFTGLGNGNIITNYLIRKSDDLKIPEIKLSVDKNNYNAILLYEKFNFSKYGEINETLFFSRKFYQI